MSQHQPTSNDLPARATALLATLQAETLAPITADWNAISIREQKTLAGIDERRAEWAQTARAAKSDATARVQAKAEQARSAAARKLSAALGDSHQTEFEQKRLVGHKLVEQKGEIDGDFAKALGDLQYRFQIARDGVAAWRLAQTLEADKQVTSSERQCANTLTESRLAREQAISTAHAALEGEAQSHLLREDLLNRIAAEARGAAGGLSNEVKRRELWLVCPRPRQVAPFPVEDVTPIREMATHGAQQMQGVPEPFAPAEEIYVVCSRHLRLDEVRGALVGGFLVLASSAGILAAVLAYTNSNQFGWLKVLLCLGLSALPWLLFTIVSPTYVLFVRLLLFPIGFRGPSDLFEMHLPFVRKWSEEGDSLQDSKRAAGLAVAFVVSLASLLTAGAHVGSGNPGLALIVGCCAAAALSCLGLRVANLTRNHWHSATVPEFRKAMTEIAAVVGALSSWAETAVARAKKCNEAHQSWVGLTPRARSVLAEARVADSLRAYDYKISTAECNHKEAKRIHTDRLKAIAEEVDRRLKAWSQTEAKETSNLQLRHTSKAAELNANARSKVASIESLHREGEAELRREHEAELRRIGAEMVRRSDEELRVITTRLEADLDRLKQLDAEARADAERARSAYFSTREQLIASARATLAQIHANAGAASAQPSGSDWEASVRGRATDLQARVGTFRLPLPLGAELLPGIDFSFEIPAFLPFSSARHTQFNCTSADRQTAVDAVQGICLRALASLPAGKLRFHFLDPLGLGQSAAAFAALGDVDEQLIGGRIWTEPTHIEQQLTKVSEHMETVIQKYLRNDYADIRDYNCAAEEVAEPFRLLVVFDYPAGFNEAAVRRLVSIARNGPRCGVHLLLMRNLDQEPMFHGTPDAELSAQQHLLVRQEDRWHWPGTPKDVGFELTPGFSKAAFDSVICQVAVELRITSLASLAPEKLRRLAGLNGAWWNETTMHGLRAPMGVVGARKVQSFHLGVGTAHHALLVGQPGSGKTKLIHSIITGLVQQYSPEELELYLIDFKGGVGFKQYAAQGLPHARVIAVETEREFGLSILNALQEEMTRRAECFRAVHAEHIAEYRERTGVIMSRILLVTDEFQEFFAMEGGDATQARTIFERTVRMGRAFGIHLLLASQTLSGSAQLGQSTRDNIAVRIVLQATEETARTALCDDNHAARQLNRPGAGIYNDASGLVEGNKPFQAALMSDEQIRMVLAEARNQAAARNLPLRTVVFEGNEAAQLAECKPLLAASVTTAPPTLWLGQPIALKAPTEIRLSRQSGRNLLVVTRLEQEGLGVLCSAWVAILTQRAPSAAIFHVLDLADSVQPWSGFAQQLQTHFPHQFNFLSRRSLAAELGQLRAEVEARHRHDQGAAQYPTHYVVLLGVHRARELRADDTMDESCAADHVLKLLRDGPPVGVHVLVWCDSARNATALFQRRGVREFGIMVAGAMSEDDSRDLLGEAVAGRLQKQHRVVILDDEHPGTYLRVRPYGLPEAAAWPTLLEHFKTPTHS